MRLSLPHLRAGGGLWEPGRDHTLQDELGRGAGDGVVAIKAGPAELALRSLGGLSHAVDGEVGQRGRPDLLADLLHSVIRSNELLLCVHVDAVVARARNRRRGDAEVHFLSASLEEEPHELAGRVPPDDGVVYHNHPLARDNRRQRVELQAQAQLAHTVSRLDERPAHVAVLYETPRERYPAAARIPHSRHESGVRHRDDHVGLGRRLLCEYLAHLLPGARDLPPVEAGVGTGEVHVFEDTKSATRALRMVALETRIVYHDDLAGLDVPQ